VTPQERYAGLVKFFLSKPRVTQEGKGFGSESLRIGGSIFALLSSRGEFVVKLPRHRVDELIESGDGHRFDPGHGRLMKEWLALRPNSTKDWKALATEAKEFVASKSR
jgi:hypothetical protein